MKNKLLMLMMMLSSSLFLVSCAKDNKSNNNQNNGYYCSQYINGQCVSGNGINGYNSCPMGQIYTQQNCLPMTAQCGSNAGYNAATNQCVQAINGGGSTGMCLATDIVQTQQGSLQQGSCVQYCQQYGKKYGYFQGTLPNGQSGAFCIPSLY